MTDESYLPQIGDEQITLLERLSNACALSGEEGEGRKIVWEGKDHIPGVIGLKPIHLVNEDERKRPVALDELRIDVGPISGKAKVGDRVAFATTFLQQGPRLRGKALDNRLGGATLIELVKHAPQQIELLAAFTVQGEIGGGGARGAAYTFDPD